LISAYDAFCAGQRDDDITFCSAASLELTVRAVVAARRG